jgi:hypothetical protein
MNTSEKVRLINADVDADDRELVVSVCIGLGERMRTIHLCAGTYAGRSGLSWRDSSPNGFDPRPALRVVRAIRRELEAAR